MSGARGVLAETMIDAYAVTDAILADHHSSGNGSGTGTGTEVMPIRYPEDALVSDDVDLESVPREIEQGAKERRVVRPCLRSMRTSSTFPDSDALCGGVIPSQSWAVAFAPRSRKMSASSASPSDATNLKCSGALPYSSVAATYNFRFSPGRHPMHWSRPVLQLFWPSHHTQKHEGYAPVARVLLPTPE